MKLLRLLCVLSGLLVQGFALDREAFTFTNYELDVRVEPAQRRLAVRGKISLRNDSTEAQRNLALQISSSLNWRSMQLGGKAVQFVSQPYTSDIDHTGALSEAIVSLPAAVPPQGTMELDIGYEGIIPLDTTRLTRIGVPEEVARHSDWDQIGKSFTAVRGIGYVVWYPVATESANLSEGSSVFETLGRWKAREVQAEMKVKLSHAGEGDVSLLLCNGQAGTQDYEQMGRAYLVTTDCRYWPLSMTVPLFIIGGYDGLDRLPVNISYLPNHRPAAENYALAAQLSVPFVTEWFGRARAAAEARAQVVDLGDPDATPYESGSMLLTPLKNNDSLLYQVTAVHQLTHADFPSPRPWIYEGLAHFAQAAYRERQSGRQGALAFMGLHRTAIADAEKALAREHKPEVAAVESLINTASEEFYRSKAMYVWWMLRDMVGEEALKKALVAYRPDQDKEPSYMPRLVEAQTKRDLEWFFEDWVYRDHGLPDFRVGSAYPRPTVGGGYLVTVTVENLGNAGAEVPVTLRMEGGEVTRRLEVHAKSKASIRIEVASTPHEIVVNDGSVPESDMSNNSYKIDGASLHR
jgi:hypothetical protein